MDPQSQPQSQSSQPYPFQTQRETMREIQASSPPPLSRGNSSRRQSLAVYSKQLSLPSMIENDSQFDMTTINTSSTVDTKSVRKALKMMRNVKLERESNSDRKKRLREASKKRKEVRLILADKQKLYACDPVLTLNSVAALKRQATTIYTDKCIKERNDKYGELLSAPPTMSKHNRHSFSKELVQQIVLEEQELLDSGIDVEKAMAMTHKEDREKYKSAREKLEEHKALQKKNAKEFYKKQAAAAREREARML